MLIPIYLPKVDYEDDPAAWKEYHRCTDLRRKQCKYMYEVDRNEWSYVYGLIKNKEILYVGLSDTPYKRYKTHLRETFKEQWDLEITLLGKGLRKEMKKVETQMIQKYKPKYNIKENKKETEKESKKYDDDSEISNFIENLFSSLVDKYT